MRCNASRASTSVLNDKFTTGCPCEVWILNPKAGPSCPDTAMLSTSVTLYIPDPLNHAKQRNLANLLRQHALRRHLHFLRCSTSRGDNETISRHSMPAPFEKSIIASISQLGIRGTQSPRAFKDFIPIPGAYNDIRGRMNVADSHRPPKKQLVISLRCGGVCSCG